MTTERYNDIFLDMVLESIACGLYKPHEMLCNYDRLMPDFMDPEELDEFMNKAIVDIYSAMYCEDLDFKEANEIYNRQLNH